MPSTNVARVRHFARFRPDVSQDIVNFFRPQAEAALDFADKSLAGREWLVGDACSIADIGCWGRMVFAHEGGMSIDSRPNLAAWRDRLKALPGFALPTISSRRRTRSSPGAERAQRGGLIVMLRSTSSATFRCAGELSAASSRLHTARCVLSIRMRYSVSLTTAPASFVVAEA